MSRRLAYCNTAPLSTVLPLHQALCCAASGGMRGLHTLGHVLLKRMLLAARRRQRRAQRAAAAACRQSQAGHFSSAPIVLHIASRIQRVRREAGADRRLTLVPPAVLRLPMSGGSSLPDAAAAASPPQACPSLTAPSSSFVPVPSAPPSHPGNQESAGGRRCCDVSRRDSPGRPPAGIAPVAAAARRRGEALEGQQQRLQKMIRSRSSNGLLPTINVAPGFPRPGSHTALGLVTARRRHSGGAAQRCVLWADLRPRRRRAAAPCSIAACCGVPSSHSGRCCPSPHLAAGRWPTWSWLRCWAAACGAWRAWPAGAAAATCHWLPAWMAPCWGSST